jgi:enediyne biosynthesis protein E4
VVNNTDDTAFVYRNNARLATHHGFVQLQLIGEGRNTFALGATVTVYASPQVLMQELMPTRGFQSSVDNVLTFGLGSRDSADSIRVDWPDGRITRMLAVAANRRITLRQSEAVSAQASARTASPEVSLLHDVTNSVAIPFVHKENAFSDFDREPLIPKLVSTEGPALAVGDVNGDGLDDMYIGGARGQAGVLLIQQRDGRFVSSSAAEFAKDAISEDVGAVFFDANGDGRPDLYVVSGGSEYGESAPALQDRLYINDGHGLFHKSEGLLPIARYSGSRPAVADYDGDGDVDVFVGGRVVPWRYGVDPPSMLLQNDGRGHFTDVTDRLAPELRRIGMVTDAVWRDVDGDGRLDLVVVGEWMPITVFHNAGGGRLVRTAVRGLENSEGWWNRIVAGDFTGNGRVDFLIGNLGLNSALRASAAQPLTMYVGDFNRNGFVEQVLCEYNGGVSYPLAVRDALINALPYLSRRFLTYERYAHQTCADLFSPAELKNAVTKTVRTFATMLARNNGDGSFTLVPLPWEAQIAPVYGILPTDIDGDGRLDVLLGGNFDGLPPQIGRLRSSYGLLLRGDGTGNFTPVRTSASGFLVPGETRDIPRLRTASGDLFIVARNNDAPLAFRRRRTAKPAAARIAP